MIFWEIEKLFFN